MATKEPFIGANLYGYLLANSLREAPLLRQLREETATLPRAVMQIAPDQGQLLALLVRLTRATRVLEVGVFTGYSSLCMALALPRDGKLIALDINEEWTAIARRYWREAGVEDKVDLRLGMATETMEALLEEGEAGAFDLVFIDADRENLERYYELSLKLLRPGGLIVIDNVLWFGRVADAENRDPDTLLIRELNQRLHGDERVDLSIVPVGDGLTLALKKAA